jgi:glucosyl-3-phosphoglycerate synthase
MAFVIMQAVMTRLDERGHDELLDDMATSMKLPRSSAHRLSLEVLDLADVERPPMVRIPEYRRKRGLPDL